MRARVREFVSGKQKSVTQAVQDGEQAEQNQAQAASLLRSYLAGESHAEAADPLGTSKGSQSRDGH